MHKHGLCRRVVTISLSVCPSRSWTLSKRMNISSFFSSSGSHTILVFAYHVMLIAGMFLSFYHSVLRWSVPVSTICRHSSRVVAFFQAVAMSKFRGPRSASIAQSQVWLGLPAGRFQSRGTCRIHAARTRWWSSRGELRVIWPKSRRRLLVTRWESGEQPVVLLTSAFDTWRVYGILKILLSAHVSNASRRESRYFVVAQVSHPYIKTGTMYVW